MDSHSFRIVGAELIDLLDGARLEKIHGPHPGVFVFTLFAGERKRKLVLRHERQMPLIFFSGRPLTNPPRPPASAMRIRKYCGGRRLGRGSMDYTARVLSFPVLTPPDEPPCRLFFDMVQGPDVRHDFPDGFGKPPLWPDGGLVDSLCGIPWRKGEKNGPWQEYTVLTPLLRETLAALEPLEGRALMVDLEEGGGGLFLYADADGRPVAYTAWPLPELLCRRHSLVPCIFPENEDSPDCGGGGLLPRFPALAAVSLIDEPRLFAALGQAVQKEEKQPLARALKKQDRLLAKLDQEQERLTAMLALREDAKRIQAELWRFPADSRLPEVRIAHGEVGEPERVIPLDPLLTVRENMARLFHQSARGARGLALLRERRADLLSAASANAVAPEAEKAAGAAAERRPGRGEADPAGATRKSINDVARFVSSDGFVMLRGKNARGNHSLLKIGGAHDLWLHAEGGPSAHLIIRRTHAAEEVPERTLQEAAVLVGEKSWQRHDARARVMVAVLRHIHAVKGASPGTVRVDSVLRSLYVSLEAPQSGESAAPEEGKEE